MKFLAAIGAASVVCWGIGVYVLFKGLNHRW